MTGAGTRVIPDQAIDRRWKDMLSGLRDGTEKPAVVSDGSTRRKTKAPKRVLVVEDNIDAARTTAVLVADMGHDAQYAINGYAALEIARKFRPEVVLLDLGLPGLDGFEVCRQLRKDAGLHDIKVVVITGYAGDEYRQHAVAAGCDLHFVKPVPAKVLEEILG
jgi:CheY-like chemotaxis protein